MPYSKFSDSKTTSVSMVAKKLYYQKPRRITKFVATVDILLSSFLLAAIVCYHISYYPRLGVKVASENFVVPIAVHPILTIDEKETRKDQETDHQIKDKSEIVPNTVVTHIEDVNLSESSGYTDSIEVRRSKFPTNLDNGETDAAFVIALDAIDMKLLNEEQLSHYPKTDEKDNGKQEDLGNDEPWDKQFNTWQDWEFFAPTVLNAEDLPVPKDLKELDVFPKRDHVEDFRDLEVFLQKTSELPRDLGEHNLFPQKVQTLPLSSSVYLPVHDWDVFDRRDTFATSLMFLYIAWFLLLPLGVLNFCIHPQIEPGIMIARLVLGIIILLLELIIVLLLGNIGAQYGILTSMRLLQALLAVSAVHSVIGFIAATRCYVSIRSINPV